ncbi:MAG TPA: nitroreductase family protein [Allosphingosinicella sp.]|nr:nitroreductase family protein [Allosphingosinicella sp.]
MSSPPDPTAARHPDHPVDPIFVRRWSPRAFDRSVIPDADLMTIFEAARWAPSAFNYQPWRLLYAKRESADWARFLSLLIPWNQGWAHNASVLIYLCSDTLMETKPGQTSCAHTHSFDTGAAWASMALQASLLGYHAHGMSGVEWDKVREELKVPARFRVDAACVIGRLGSLDVLDEKLKAREVPSARKPVADFAFAGDFPA